ncbi:MAG: DnaJ domain-containing protein [Marinilabiliaceae bacterium]|nr:DnaJ domain-containing protein [Marinilabiliaceae bacterium]
MGFLSSLLIFWLIYTLIKNLSGGNTNGQGNSTYNRSYSYYNPNYEYGHNRQGDFETALLQLIAVTMRADGHVRKIELEFVKTKLIEVFGVQRAQNALLKLRDILKTDINVHIAASNIRHHLDYNSRLIILQILYGIAQADGVVTDEEAQIVSRIAASIGITSADAQSIFGTFASADNLDAAYKVLQIDKSATDTEVKKAYRTMAMKYHPDKVAGMGADVEKRAEETFRKVQEAYEKICKARGIK